MSDKDAVRPKWAPVCLPKEKRDWVRKQAPCPDCGRMSQRHSRGRRWIRDVNCLLDVRYSKHYCGACRRVFSYYDKGVVEKNGRYAKELKRLAVGWVRAGKTQAVVSCRFGVPQSTLAEWVCDARDERMRQVPSAPAAV